LSVSEYSPAAPGNACVVCWRGPADRAHLIDRSLAPDPHGDPRRVIFLCREHHEAYDNHRLDLLPYLENTHRSELARAVELVGLVATLERVTGCKWGVWDDARVAAVLEYREHEWAASKPLRPGDVIEGPAGRRYFVQGFTSRGKTRVLSERTGAESARWWGTREQLPRGYRWVMWMGSLSNV
jgi:hypothetical protein